MSKLQTGDRIAYAAKFLKDTCQQTGGAGDRRGTYIGPSPYPGLHLVHWDDFETLATLGQGQYADAEWVDDCRKHGSLVGDKAIARVGPARFACNDL